MTATQISYLTFGIVLILALIFDLGLLSKKNSEVSIKKALYQTIFWVGLAMTLSLARKAMTPLMVVKGMITCMEAQATTL